LTTTKDQVRFLVGDTDSNDGLIADEEINFALIENPNIYLAGAMVADAVSARLARELTLKGSAGSIELDAQAQSKAFADLAIKLRARAAMTGGAGVFAGGISKSDKQTRADDEDRVKPGFSSHLHRFKPLMDDANPNELLVEEP